MQKNNKNSPLGATREFLPTPFLWPVSDWAFPGISWGARWFMMLNASIIAIGYSYFFIYRPWRQGKFKETGKKIKKK